MSKVVRSVKNVTKGYSSVQVKVRNGMFPSFFMNVLFSFPSFSLFICFYSIMLIYYYFVRIATSNDPWGPTGTEMGEIAAMTFHRLAITPLYKDPLQSYSRLLVSNFSYFLTNQLALHTVPAISTRLWTC